MSISSVLESTLSHFRLILLIKKIELPDCAALQEFSHQNFSGLLFQAHRIGQDLSFKDQQLITFYDK